jgi:hypothetical protein
MVNLTTAQRGHLEAVRTARALERAARANLEAEIRARLTAEVEAMHGATVRAVRAAADAGVPLRQIGRDGLGTADHATVRRMLEEGPQRKAPTGLRAATDAERTAAGILAGEGLAVVVGERLAIRDSLGEWEALEPSGTPAPRWDDATRARLDAFAPAD